MSADPKPSRWFVWPSEIRDLGIVGINERNATWMLPNNPRHLYPRVDNKLMTKQLCENTTIPVPKTLAVIERHGDLKRLGEILAPLPSFVIKPAEGAGGRGILVVLEHDGEIFHTAAKGEYGLGEIKAHISSILSGLFSLGGRPDKAILEQRILPHPVFAEIAVGGTPDIRVVVSRGIPVMAMLRLPTHESKGKANLHQGAIGAGVHLSSGMTRGGVIKNRAVSHHPDTGASIVDVEVPFWDRILWSAAKLYDVLEMGYYGADFVLDQELGPIVLEANARPGLAVQIANRCGLGRRLAHVEALPTGTMTVDERMSHTETLAGIR